MWTVGYNLRWVLGVSFMVLGIFYLGGTQAGFDAEKIMPLVLLKMPVGLRGLFMAVLLAALMSTISAMINVTSSVVINDFVKRYIAKDLSQKKLVRLGQIASVAAVLIGFVFSLSFTNIVTAWEMMVFVVVTVILVPATLRWHYWRFGAKAFVWSMGASAVLISLRLILVKGLHASASLAIDVGIGLVTTIAAAALTKPADMEILVKFYTKVRPFGFWGPVRRECVKRGLVPANDKMPKIDMLNGLITAGFQFSLAILPFYLFMRNWKQLGMWTGAAAAIAVILYFTWYKNLPSRDDEDRRSEMPKNAVPYI